ncbi:MAG: lactate racemase domain-containing protein [Clostridiales bacterium]|jgi:nickel-dependent lactate racemase|nr:lactate racemase domain-containing protein [Clostridiales bacterium]
MKEFFLTDQNSEGISNSRLSEAVNASVSGSRKDIKRALLIVPDFTRFHSNAGRIANLYYHALGNTVQTDLLAALGTHAAMTPDERAAMYGDIPNDRFIMHDWRGDVKRIGRVPAEFVSEVSEGLVNTAIDVEVNKRLYAGYDLILSIGQVVPHEVVGMANHSKNIFVGCGGPSMINSSHMLGAFVGLERIMGKDHSAVRKVFDYAAENFLAGLPIAYVLSVTTAPGGKTRTHGVYAGTGREWFERAVAHAQAANITFVRPLPKVVVYLDPNEFKSTWLGNKSIYRTRMAIADGGELIVLAPGVDKFGEDNAIDSLIRKYGYAGREEIIRLVGKHEDLRGNLSAAAHLIHGSGDGRFTITYCTQHLRKDEVEGVKFQYTPYAEAAAKYAPDALKDGFNTLADGEEIYYISNPALGLWADKSRFYAEGSERGTARH